NEERRDGQPAEPESAEPEEPAESAEPAEPAAGAPEPEPAAATATAAGQPAEQRAQPQQRESPAALSRIPLRSRGPPSRGPFSLQGAYAWNLPALKTCSSTCSSGRSRRIDAAGASRSSGSTCRGTPRSPRSGSCPPTAPPPG